MKHFSAEFVRCVNIIALLSVLMGLAACQSDSGTGGDGSPEPLPTVMSLDSVNTALTPAAPLAATRELRTIPTRDVTVTPSATVTPVLPTADLTLAVTPTITRTVTIPPPVVTAAPAEFDFGLSGEGRPLSARRFGTGEQVLIFVGGIHTGYEANTVALMRELIVHFEANPGDVLPGVTLIFVPVLNPDGMTKGRTLDGRFNGAQVDLNRNWGCDWEAVAYFQQREVSPGAAAMSEPETQALAALITEIRPAAVLFYHAAANGVFSGECDGQDAGSAALAAALGDATGYPYGDDFSQYTVTGTGPAWVVSQGIASADVELASAEITEFARNLRGVMAVQCWSLGPAASSTGACANT